MSSEPVDEGFSYKSRRRTTIGARKHAVIDIREGLEKTFNKLQKVASVAGGFHCEMNPEGIIDNTYRQVGRIVCGMDSLTRLREKEDGFTLGFTTFKDEISEKDKIMLQRLGGVDILEMPYDDITFKGDIRVFRFNTKKINSRDNFEVSLIRRDNNRIISSAGIVYDNVESFDKCSIELEEKTIMGERNSVRISCGDQITFDHHIEDIKETYDNKLVPEKK